MAQQNVCRYHKFGHCKFSEKCRMMHIDEICGNCECDIKICNLRHPRICNYFRDYRRCKFGQWCSFRHEPFENKNIDDRISEVERMLKEKADLDQKIQMCDKKLAEIEIYLSKFETYEKQISEKDIIIGTLQSNVKDLEIRLLAVEKKNIESEENVEKLEPASKPIEKYDCDKCDFETNSKKGLNIHKKRKHTNYRAQEYPKSCDICEKTLKSAKEMQKHMRTHSFTGQFSHWRDANYNCEDCDFTSKTIETMEVHTGKCRTDNFECGLCEYTGNTLDNLELHLVSCEVYECEECQLRSRFLKEIKTHVERDHGIVTNVYHLKMDRNDSTLVDFKHYKSDKI